MKTKIIGTVLLICSALIFQYSYISYLGSIISPNIDLKGAIETDIMSTFEREFKNDKQNIHHVQFTYRSSSAHNILKRHPLQLVTTKEGVMWLEVEIFDLPDKNNPGIITQTSVFDLKTNNKISEFSHFYYISNFQKNTESNLKKRFKSPTEKINTKKSLEIQNL